MFHAPFSFDGRISRTEYWLSLAIYLTLYLIILTYVTSNSDSGIVGLAFIPLLWFLWAQGAKRCHDVGNSGWYQIIPFYVLWMLFQAGSRGANDYGRDPKGNLLVEPLTANKVKVVDERIDVISPSTPQVTRDISKSATPVRVIPNDGVTVLEILNINYSLVQDFLKSLRQLEITNHLSYEFLDTTAKITINHQNTSQVLLENLYTMMGNIEVLAVADGSLKIKLK